MRKLILGLFLLAAVVAFLVINNNSETLNLRKLKSHAVWGLDCRKVNFLLY